MLYSKKGFTLIEIIISLGLAGVIFSVVTSLAADLYRSKRALEEGQILSSAHYFFYTQMENKIRWAKEISATGHSLTFKEEGDTLADDDDIVHTLTVNANHQLVDSYDSSELFLTSEEIEVIDFEVENFSPTKDPLDLRYLPSLKFTLNLRSKQEQTYFSEKSFVLSLRRKNVDLD